MKYFISIICIAFFLSCTKQDKHVKLGDMEISFVNNAGTQKLALGNISYTNSSSEPFTITTLKYYVSNFILTSTNGEKYIVPQDSCYFLIDESNPASLKPRLNIPNGSYSNLSFMIGVDSLRNTKDLSQRIGVLDPTAAAADMYWTWNSGYIFFKMEGNSIVSPQTDKSFRFHIGLFGGYSSGTLNNTRIVSINLTPKGNASIVSGKTSHVTLNADILSVFNSVHAISIANSSVIMATANSGNVADNYAHIFSHAGTINE